MGFWELTKFSPGFATLRCSRAIKRETSKAYAKASEQRFAWPYIVFHSPCFVDYTFETFRTCNITRNESPYVGEALGSPKRSWQFRADTLMRGTNLLLNNGYCGIWWAPASSAEISITDTFRPYPEHWPKIVDELTRSKTCRWIFCLICFDQAS